MAIGNCFFESQEGHPIARRAFAEGLGTMLLVVVVAGAAMAMPPRADAGAELVTIAFAASGALVGLIICLGPLSGGHFNPLITFLQWLGRERSSDCTLAYIAAQIVGAITGSLVANALHPAATYSQTGQGLTTSLLLSEFISSAGLLMIVQACSRSGAGSSGPFAVGAWLGGAIVATPTLSVANPAIVAAALVARGALGMGRHDAAMLCLVELAGAVFAYMMVRIAYPKSRFASSNSSAEGDAVSKDKK